MSKLTLATLDITDFETFSLMEGISTALRAWLHCDDVGSATQGPDKVAVSAGKDQGTSRSPSKDPR